MKGTCEVCMQPDRHVGNFRVGKRLLSCVCGACKVRLTLTPVKVAQLRAEVTLACAPMSKPPGQA